jgi:MFS transporter, DHA1 family, multidrug resistance protein
VKTIPAQVEHRLDQPPDVRPDPTWHLNFSAILLCQLLVSVIFTSVSPFVPLFLRELGEDQAGAAAWTGAINSAGSTVQLLAIPVSGFMGDRVGRKRMIVRALVGAMFTFGGMSLVVAPWHAFIVRCFQGVAAAPAAPLIALAAATLPAERLSLGMGMLQTAQFLG